MAQVGWPRWDGQEASGHPGGMKPAVEAFGLDQAV